MSNPERFTLRVAVTLVLIKEDKILLGRRRNTFAGNGDYGLIGGHLDGDEPVTIAMAREAKEEIGIELNPKDLKLIHVQHLKLPPEYVNFFFTVTSWQGEPKIMEPDKCDDLRWFPLNALPENRGQNIVYAINQYQNGKFYSEHGWK